MRKSEVNLPGENAFPRLPVPSRLFGWTDPESGQRLTVRMRGTERFLQALEPLGFEALEARDGQPDVEAEPAPRKRSWISVKAHLNPEG